MVPVSDPANASETPEECVADLTTHQTRSDQVDVCGESVAQTETVNDLEATDLAETDAAQLAARILQLSASNELQLPQRAKKPELLWEDDNPLDVPEILMSSGVSGPDPEERAALRHRLQPAQYGPSFKALLFSTLLITVAGSGAIALGIPEMVGDLDPQPLEVQTETITPGFSSHPKATDRIQQAFQETRPANQVKEIRIAGRSILESRPQPVTAQIAKPEPSSVIKPPPSTLPVSPEQPLTGKQTTTFDATSEAVASEPETNEEEKLAALTPTSKQDHQVSNSGTVTAAVNLRQTDDKNGKIIGVVPEGTKVSYSDCGKWWCKVDYDGTTGFVGQKFVRR